MSSDLKKYCVYLITCLVNGKQYCGQTSKTVSQRWTGHKSAARTGYDIRFSRAIRKYGEDNFVVSTLREGLTKEQADEEEKLTIKILRLTDPELGYNLSGGGDGGAPISEEMRKKMSENAPFRRHDVADEDVISLYRSGLSMTQISEKFGMSHRSIGRRLLLAGEPIRSISEMLTIRTGPKASNEEINKMYLSGLDSTEIAEKLEVDPTTIRKRLHDSGTIRTRSEAQTLQRGVLNDTQVVRLYREGKSLTDIGKLFGVSHPAVRYRLVKLGEPRRSISEASLLARRTKNVA